MPNRKERKGKDRSGCAGHTRSGVYKVSNLVRGEANFRVLPLSCS